MRQHAMSWQQLSQTKTCVVEELMKRGEYACKIIQQESRNRYLCYQYDISLMVERSKAQLKKEIQRFSALKGQLFTHFQKICIRSEQSTSQSFLCLLTEYNEIDKPLSETINKLEIDLSETIESFKVALFELAQSGLTHNNIRLESMSIQEKYIKIGLPLFSSMDRQNRKKNQLQQNNILMSPQIREGYGLSIASDIWDAGVVLLQIAIRQNFKTIELSEHYILRKLVKIQNKKDRSIIQRMLNKDRNKRCNLNWVFDEQNKQHFNMKTNEKQINRIPLFNLPEGISIRQKKEQNDKNTNYSQAKVIELTEHYALEVRQRPQNLLLSVVNRKQSQTLFERINVKRKKSAYKINQIYELTNDGFISIKVPQNLEKNLHFGNNPEEQKYKYKKNREFPQNSMVNLKGYYNKKCIRTGQGFLICHNMILTTARFLYERSNNFPTVQIKIQHERTKLQTGHYSCHFPEEYMSSSEEESANYDYALIILQGSVNEALQIGLLYDFDEDRLAEWAEQTLRSLSYCYEVNGISYDRSQLNHPKQKIRSLNTTQKDEGCPLMIEFQNGQFLAIGIALSNKKCLLFSYEQINNIYRWASEAPDLKEGRERFHYSFRAFSSNKFAFWHPSMELQFPSIMQCTTETISNLYDSQQYLLAGFVYERLIQSLKTNELKDVFLKKIILKYEHSYGEDYPNLAYLYSRLGDLQERQDEAIKTYLKAERILQSNPFNLHFYSALLIKLAKISMYRLDFEAAKYSLMRSIEMSEDNNYWWCLERSKFQYGKICMANNNIEAGISYFQKSIQISGKYLEGGRNPAAFIFLAEHHIGLLLLESSFEIINYDFQTNELAGRLFDVAAEKVLQNFSFLTSEQLIQVLHRIIKRHLSSRMQILTAMESKSLI